MEMFRVRFALPMPLATQDQTVIDHLNIYLFAAKARHFRRKHETRRGLENIYRRRPCTP